ncbi:hypothetical protein LUZ63_009943 [Rhynchospora breviuscula]|uniref:Uncharacterized protein n=1 Tax=Rhynchospora breviuscula TaxID=2022672 RepID=A0A9Q0CG93_9POAL|nr:hypothetical protein LUZ63_009943 [Rhynchospora breviuscula]
MLLLWRAELAYEKDASGSTPLHYAASDDDVAVVQKILDRAPLAVYIRDEEGSSPLHVAARMCHYSTINSMIDRYPDSFELRDNQGRNFLHIVAQHGWRINSLALISPLMAQYCRRISSLAQRISPLMAQRGNRHGWRKLAKRINLDCQGLKILVNERDNEGNTPLHWASMNGTSDMIMELFEVNKADTTVINNEGKTALDHSISLDSAFLMVISKLLYNLPVHQDIINYRHPS